MQEKTEGSWWRRIQVLLSALVYFTRSPSPRSLVRVLRNWSPSLAQSQILRYWNLFCRTEYFSLLQPATCWSKYDHFPKGMVWESRIMNSVKDEMSSKNIILCLWYNVAILTRYQTIINLLTNSQHFQVWREVVGEVRDTLILGTESIILSEGLQTLPACPSDKNRMK